MTTHSPGRAVASEGVGSGRRASVRLVPDVVYHGVSVLSLKGILIGFVLLVVVICVAPPYTRTC
jgi:hypothetical protein